MAEFWTVKMAGRGDQRYVGVTDETKTSWVSCGLADWEVYSQFGYWDIVDGICRDSKAVAELKKLFLRKEKKPILIAFSNNAYRTNFGQLTYPPRDLKKANFFNGNNWYGTLSEEDDVWLLTCFSRLYHLY